MLTTKLHKIFTTTQYQKFWFSLSLTFSLIYSLLALQEAFSSQYVVQDDARQHVFWMVRFLDAKLFPNDLIADYFQSVAPIGYKLAYQIPAWLGINPLLLNKFLPTLLGLGMTGYCFGVAMQIFPIPAAGFITTLLLNQNMWMKDDIISATPRAFVYPLFLAFLYYVLRRNIMGVGVAIALLGMFYPQCVFICCGILILRLIHWQNWLPHICQNRTDLTLSFTGLGVAFLVMLPFALTASKFGPPITAATAKTLPEFLPGGRSSFFRPDVVDYFLTGYRSGMFPRSLFTPVTLCVGLILPILVRFPSQFPILRQITSKAAILPQILLASIGMFFAAHAVLFKLHLPSRYTGITFRILIAIATAIALTAIIDKVLSWAINSQPITQAKFKTPIAWITTLTISILLIGYPSFVANFPKTSYRIGTLPELYQFFQQTPKDTIIASLADEVNNIPTFSQRSILVGSEYAIPYHTGYYNQFRQRTIDLIRAQYTPNLGELKDFISKYSINYWLLDPGGLTPEYLASHRRIQQYQPVATQTLEQLKQGNAPALLKVTQGCQAFAHEGFVVVQTDCIK